MMMTLPGCGGDEPAGRVWGGGLPPSLLIREISIRQDNLSIVNKESDKLQNHEWS